MKILKINHIPSKKYILGYLLNNKIINEVNNNNIKELFDIFENELNPILLAKKGVKYLSKILNEEEYKPYIKKIEENLIIKVLMLMPSLYKNISLSRVINLFKDLNIEEYEINDIISESSRINLFKCKIDLRNNIIKFITNDSSQDRFNNIIENFLKNSKKAIKEIIINKNRTKINIIKDKIYEEMRNNNSKSLVVTNALLEESKKQNKKLKNYINKRDKLKLDLKLKTAETKEKNIRLLQDKEQLEKDRLRSEQEQKELEAEMKRYLIDSLRKFTNSIILKDGKRIKLDDLLKDLNKITPEELINHYDEQKIESASKKEKELKKDTKRKDYILREFRKRDMEKYEKELEKEIKKSDKKKQKEIETELKVRDEVLKYKKYKDSYCDEIEKKNLDNYKKEVKEYYTYLKEKVTEDIYKELDSFFDIYIDDFTKKQMAENQQKKALDTWTPYDIDKDKEAKRGEKFTDVKIEKKQVKEFIRSQNANQNLAVDEIRKKEKSKNKDKEQDGKMSWRGGGDEKKEDKKEDKKDDNKKKGGETKKEDNWRARGDNKKDEKKEDNWRGRGDNKKDEKKHENKKEEDNWRGRGDNKKEDKKHETKKENKDNWRSNEEPKKEEKKIETKKDEGNWRRGEEPKKEEKKTETKKDEGSWRRGEEPKKDEKKPEQKKKKQTKKNK